MINKYGGKQKSKKVNSQAIVSRLHSENVSGELSVDAADHAQGNDHAVTVVQAHLEQRLVAGVSNGADGATSDNVELLDGVSELGLHRLREGRVGSVATLGSNHLNGLATDGLDGHLPLGKSVSTSDVLSGGHC